MLRCLTTGSNAMHESFLCATGIARGDACQVARNLLGWCTEIFIMSNYNDTAQPDIRIENTSDYRDSYANSVQVRISVWDFFLSFGRALPSETPTLVLQNFQGVYLSPQQAKALSIVLQQNVANYEKAFGEIKLDPQFAPGPVH